MQRRGGAVFGKLNTAPRMERGRRACLRRGCSARLRCAAPDGTSIHSWRAAPSLQPTALVNEVCLRLLGSTRCAGNRGHFLGVSAQMMRRVFVEHRATAQDSPPGWRTISFACRSIIQHHSHQPMPTSRNSISRWHDWHWRRQKRKSSECGFFGGLSMKGSRKRWSVTTNGHNDWAFTRASFCRALTSSS